MKNIKHIFCKLLPLVLVAAMALSLASCGKEELGDGLERSFVFEVYLEDGTLHCKDEITSTKATVGEALADAGLLKGEKGPYGLYVKEIDGIFAEYESTGTYWAFYVGGEVSMRGVDTTPIEDGQVYGFRIEK